MILFLKKTLIALILIILQVKSVDGSINESYSKARSACLSNDINWIFAVSDLLPTLLIAADFEAMDACHEEFLKKEKLTWLTYPSILSRRDPKLKFDKFLESGFQYSFKSTKNKHFHSLNDSHAEHFLNYFKAARDFYKHRYRANHLNSRFDILMTSTSYSPSPMMLKSFVEYVFLLGKENFLETVVNSLAAKKGLQALLKAYVAYKVGDDEKVAMHLETLDRFGQGLPQLFDEKEFRARYKLRKARDWVPTRKYWELLTDYCKTAKEEEKVVEAVYKAAIGAQFNTLKTCLRNGSSASSTLSRVSQELSSGSLEDALKAVPSKDWRLKSAINLYIQSVLDPKSKELAQGLLKRNIGQVKVDGFHIPVAVGMMDHLIPAGRASYAVSVLHEVEKFKKYSARLHNLYGYYYVKIKSYDKALERYEKARRLDANLELLHSLKDVKALRDKAKKEKAKKVPKARSTASAKSKSNSSKASSSQPTLQSIQAQYHIALKKYQSAKNPQEKKKAMSEMKALDAQFAKLKGQSSPAKTKKKSPVVFKDKAGIDKYYGERLAELSAALINSTSPEQSRQIAKRIESTKKEHTLKLSQLAAMQKNSASKKAGEAHSCHKCKAKLNANAKFCHQCGTSTQQKVNCSKCNKSWPADHKFCQSCGNKL